MDKPVRIGLLFERSGQQLFVNVSRQAASAMQQQIAAAGLGRTDVAQVGYRIVHMDDVSKEH